MSKKTDKKPEQEEPGQEEKSAKGATSAESAGVEATVSQEANTSMTETGTPPLAATEKSDTVTSPTEPAATVASTKSTGTKSTATKTASQTPLWLAFMVLVIILVVAAWFGWQQWQNLQGQQQQNLDTLQARTEANARALQAKTANEAQLQKQLQDARQTIDALLQQQGLQQQRLDSHSQRLATLSGTSREDWLLAEARYLLRLANQRLLVEGGTGGAVSLLEAADKIITSIDNNDLLPTRNAIAQEIVALKLSDVVDREGIYLKLSALKQQIQRLPLVPFIKETKSKEQKDPETENDNTPKSAASNNNSTAWYHTVASSFQNAFANLGKLIQVRQYDTAPELLVSEQYQVQVISTLLLKLEQAQFALLHGENTIYQHSLTETRDWWRNYYGHYREYAVIDSELVTLQQITVEAALPNVNRSLNLLTDYIERFHRLNAGGKNLEGNNSGEQQP